MSISPSDYGPFAPVVGYSSAIAATVMMLFSLWGGRMKKWRPPDEDVPGAAQGVIILLCGIMLVIFYYYAEPKSIGILLGLVTIISLSFAFCFAKYVGLLSMHSFNVETATSNKKTTVHKIIGGHVLLPDAAKVCKKRKIDVQTLLKGSAYNPDLLWSRESRTIVKQKVLLYFILTLVLGTSSLAGAGFVVQVLVTGKSAVSSQSINTAS